MTLRVPCGLNDVTKIICMYKTKQIQAKLSSCVCFFLNTKLETSSNIDTSFLRRRIEINKKKNHTHVLVIVPSSVILNLTKY